MPEQALIADLNDLLQLDHDAVEAYTLAIDVVRDDRYREALVAHRADHKRHIEELGALIRGRGGLPTELPHPTAPLKLVVQALGSAPNDRTLLLAFKAVEGQVRDKYRRHAGRDYPEDVAEVVRRAAEDEVRHYQWAEDSLRELGAGAGTIPHAVASAIEAVHKVLADPIESAGRRVMEQVGNVVGTVRSRGGGMAPPPRAAAAGMADAAQEAGVTDSGAFIAALRALEESGDLDPMLALYHDESETGGPNDEMWNRGREGARRFWKMYRDSFTDITSTFTHVVDGGDGTVMLEWTSRGTSRTGQPVAYAGVSVVEMRDGQIRRFRTYFNPRDVEAMGRSPERATATRPDAEEPGDIQADLGGT